MATPEVWRVFIVDVKRKQAEGRTPLNMARRLKPTVRGERVRETRQETRPRDSGQEVKGPKKLPRSQKWLNYIEKSNLGYSRCSPVSGLKKFRVGGGVPAKRSL